MADQGFEFFHVPQKLRIQNLPLKIQTSTTQTPPSSSTVPNDAVFSFHYSHANYSNPPLYQLFSDDRPNGVVSLRGVDHFALPDTKLRSSVPLGPFTGYASILRRSSFLKPAQQLLDDFCGSGPRVSDDPTVVDELSSSGKDPTGVSVQVGYPNKNSRLMFMLEEVRTLVLRGSNLSFYADIIA